MFERFSRAAERAATGLSRRQFFGRLGRGAVAAAAAAGGVLAAPAAAPAGGGVCGPGSVLPCKGHPFYSTCRRPGFGAGVCRPFSNGDCGCY